MDRNIVVKHTIDRHGNPLAIIQNMPGEGAEFSSAQLRRFAHGLLEIAAHCDHVGVMARPENVTYCLDTVGLENPFEAFHQEITGGYSTAQRLAALVKHLYNGAAHPVRLDNLLANADERHTEIAQRCIAWYARHGENCPVFMNLARHLVERDRSFESDN